MNTEQGEIMFAALAILIALSTVFLYWCITSQLDRLEGKLDELLKDKQNPSPAHASEGEVGEHK